MGASETDRNVALTRLLSQVVGDSGRVSYAVLADRRDELAAVVQAFAETSPLSDPVAFPTDADRLAYWINAYNLFTLDAIMYEYPITSVWKARDGQFFQRRRHVAGGVAVSLDDIEHEILRGELREPRIHFAINCGSNGCPALRPEAWAAEGIDDTLREATRSFLASEWNCRIDEETQSIHVSRLFKMYAEDFAGDAATTEAYREGVLRFVAEHTGRPLETLLGYELRYNTYDWGLNDEDRDPHLGPIEYHEPDETFHPGDGELRELHLYEGNLCNRTCSWCTVGGSPEGWRTPYTRSLVEDAVRSLAKNGNLKFYGGEPTIKHREVIAAMEWAREAAFEGRITIFSNGILADRLIEILESDARSEAVLNYSIFHGRDAEPLPASARRRLEAWAAANPHRVFKGYKVLFHAGSAAELPVAEDREADFHGLGKGCVRCFPVLNTRGRYHACPFAAEVDAPHFDLGKAGDPPARVFERYKRFRTWIDETLDPTAERMGITSCELCHTRLAEIETPDFDDL
jgi:hypothetical protein